MLQSMGSQRVAHNCVTELNWMYVSLLLSQFIQSSPSPTVSTSLFSMSTSPFISVQFSLWVVSDSLQPHELQHTRPPCPSPTPRVYPNPCPLTRWCHLTISTSVVPFSSCLQSFPTSGSFQMSQLFHQVAKIFEFQLQHQSFQWTPRTDLLYDGLVGSSCSPRDSQESSPTPQFKSIDSSVLSFLYSPTLTSTHNYRKNHSLD